MIEYVILSLPELEDVGSVVDFDTDILAAEEQGVASDDDAVGVACLHWKMAHDVASVEFERKDAGDGM